MALKFGKYLLVAAVLPLITLPAKAQSENPLISSLPLGESIPVSFPESALTNTQGCVTKALKPRILFCAYHQGNNEIYSIASDGTDLRRLTNNPASDTYPTWDATGSKIIFQSNRHGNNEIYFMNADGSSVRRLTNTTTHEYFPSVSQDGSKIVFLVDDGSGDEVWTMSSNGTGRTFIATMPGGLFIDPVFSFDSTKIALWTFSDNTHNRKSVYTLNSDGTGLLRLSSDDNFETEGAGPSFSPDGRRIIYNRSHIWTMKMDGTHRSMIPSLLPWSFLPSYSQDGSQIAFGGESSSNPQRLDLFVMNSDGTGRQQLTFTGKLNFCRPSWSQPAGPFGF